MNRAVFGLYMSFGCSLILVILHQSPDLMVSTAIICYALSGINKS